MNVVVTVSLLGIAYWKGDWKNWHKYALTLYYVIICNLLYNYFCHDFLLWQYKEETWHIKHFIIDLAYTFITLPAITLLFLTYYPNLKTRVNQGKYIIYWVVGSMLIELPIIYLNELIMNNGYEYWMDLFFYTVMYIMIRLHFVSPIKSYFFSIIIIVFMLWYFNVPLQ